MLKGNANDRASVSGIVQKIQKFGRGVVKKQFNLTVKINRTQNAFLEKRQC